MINKDTILGTQLFVHRLSFFTNHQELKTLFAPFGVVKEARLIRDPKTQRPKGFGFVTFETEAEAQKALKAMNGRIVRGRLIFVEYANDKSQKTDADS
ncbi:small RNA-binding protein 11, chloroplastic [Gossypium hirsutum]|uniref:Small RNA-binding protein 11, chloroplastic n=1 Tax=Gossypium hirsutum TaxID=3635 RepID=A0A1U8PQR8_GOSHI|nr:small RNA-binding protein 11, chloroplastic-like [Gossypium hirsutum]